MTGQEERLNQECARGPVLEASMREQWIVLSM